MGLISLQSYAAKSREMQLIESKRAFVAGMLIGHTMTCAACEIADEDTAIAALTSLNSQLVAMGQELGE